MNTLMKIQARRTAILVLTALLCTPLASGCWDRLEIEERGTVLGVAINPLAAPEGAKTDEVSGADVKGATGGYTVAAQLAIPGRIPLGPSVGGGGTTERPVWVIRARGKTINTAMNRLQQDLADKLFIGQMRVIIVNEQVARTYGLQDMQDYFRRNTETRRLTWLLVSRGSAEKALQASPKLERVPTLYLVGIMDHAVKLGKMPNLFLGNFWSILSSKGRDSVLPLISVQHDLVRLDGLAVFHNDRMVGSLSPVEVAAYMEMTGQKRAGYSLAVPMPGNPGRSVMLRGILRRQYVKVRMRRRKPSFDLYLNVDCYIEEMPAESGRLSQAVLAALDRELEDMMLYSQVKLLRKLRRLHADIAGFGEYIRAYEPALWERMKTRGDWDAAFSRLPVRFHITGKVVRTGLITD